MNLAISYLLIRLLKSLLICEGVIILVAIRLEFVICGLKYLVQSLQRFQHTLQHCVSCISLSSSDILLIYSQIISINKWICFLLLCVVTSKTQNSYIHCLSVSYIHLKLFECFETSNNCFIVCTKRPIDRLIRVALTRLSCFGFQFKILILQIIQFV